MTHIWVVRRQTVKQIINKTKKTGISECLWLFNPFLSGKFYHMHLLQYHSAHNSPTSNLRFRRVLRNNRHVAQPAVVSRGHPITYGGVKHRPNIYNVKLGIPAPHSAQTNAGYSRREDGGLYKVWNICEVESKISRKFTVEIWHSTLEITSVHEAKHLWTKAHNSMVFCAETVQFCRYVPILQQTLLQLLLSCI